MKRSDKVPGPKALALIEKDSKYISPSYTRPYPLVIDQADGLWVKDVDGNMFLDFTAGIAVNATGHSHPKVVEAIINQAGKFIHMSGTDFYYESQIELAEKMCSLVPIEGDKKAFFANSGAEAVEAAFKLARYATGRKLNIAFYGAFHGRTMGALSLTASKSIQKREFSPFVPGVTHIDYPHCYRCLYNTNKCDCDLDCVKYLENVVFKKKVNPEEVAAIFVEPIQGEGGYIVPPKEFHQELRRITKEHGILYVADEIQSGMGRTGKMFAMELFYVQPDIITIAKGVASGMPLGIMVAPADLMQWAPGSHASTFGGNPISCAAALATIKLLEEGVMQNAYTEGLRLRAHLELLEDTYECIGDVRGRGLMVAIEIVDENGNPDPELRDMIIANAFEERLLLLGCGESSIRFCPSLTVNASEIELCITTLALAMGETENGE